MGEGHAVQVVIQEDHTYRLDTKELKKILERDDVKDLPVAVVSVAGAFRSGKSFLLNFLLRYLMAPQSARDDGTWLGGEETALGGFSWRGGSERNTTGILMWSEPMFCTSSTGEKIEPDQPKELQELRQHMRMCFEKVTCFLMPHPGLQVLSPKFQGKIKEISPDFKTYLNELATSLFASDKLCVKQIHGTTIKASELCVYFTNYMAIVNSNELPTPTSILKATSEATLQLASSESRKLYERTMEAACGSSSPSMTPDILRAEHTAALEKARKSFLDKKKIASEDAVSKALNQLDKDFENRLDEYLAMNTSKMYLAMNEAKEAYDNYITTLRNGKPFCVHPLDVTRTPSLAQSDRDRLASVTADLDIAEHLGSSGVHNDAVNAAMKSFDQHRRHSNVDNERQNFLQSFDHKLIYLEMSNEQNNKLAINEIRFWYWDYMYGRIDKWPPMSNYKLSTVHTSALDTARLKLDEARLVHNSQTDVYSQKLTEKILLMYEQLKTINGNNLEMLTIYEEQIDRTRRERYL